MPFYVSFRAMLRCLCLVTSMKMVAKAYGNKSCSFILLLAWWLLLPELFYFCIPTKKNRKKESVIFYTSICCKLGCESTLRSTGKTRTVCSEHWNLIPHKCSESFIASLHWFFHSPWKVNNGSKNAPVFWRKKKGNSNRVINAAWYNCNKYICLDFYCWNKLLDQYFHSEIIFFSILLAPSPL